MLEPKLVRRRRLWGADEEVLIRRRWRRWDCSPPPRALQAGRKYPCSDASSPSTSRKPGGWLAANRRVWREKCSRIAACAGEYVRRWCGRYFTMPLAQRFLIRRTRPRSPERWTAHSLEETGNGDNGDGWCGDSGVVGKLDRSLPTRAWLPSTGLHA